MFTWGRLTDLINNGKRLDEVLAFTFIFSLDYVQQFAIDLNTGSPNNNEYGQLFLNGIDSEGKSLIDIGGGYAPITKDLKRFEGLPFDRVTLYDSGEFYKSWKFIQDKDSFILQADSIKEGGDDLTKRWGKDIIGLTDESISRLNKEILPEVINYVLRTLLS